MPERPIDEELERSTTRWMVAGIALTVLLVLAFPAYRLYEPASRADARDLQQASLVDQGADLFRANCASCHGVNGEGIDAPALNSRQFLTTASDAQITGLIRHGVPGTEMSAYSIDVGGFLTSEQIQALTAYLRSLEPDAPDRPDWRFPQGAGGGHDEEPADAHDEEPADAHDEEPADAHADEEATTTTSPATTTTEAGFDAAAVYASTCARCHGADLSGGDGPALGPSSHSLGEPDEHLFEAIKFGRDEMPAFIDEFTDEQIEAIIAYIREVQAGS